MLLNNMTQLKEIVFRESGAPFLATVRLCVVKQVMLLPWDWGSLSVTGELWIVNSLVLQELLGLLWKQCTNRYMHSCFYVLLFNFDSLQKTDKIKFM